MYICIHRPRNKPKIAPLSPSDSNIASAQEQSSSIILCDDRPRTCVAPKRFPKPRSRSRRKKKESFSMLCSDIGMSVSLTSVVVLVSSPRSRQRASLLCLSFHRLLIIPVAAWEGIGWPNILSRARVYCAPIQHSV